MTEIREVLARAMRAQGKADPDEVFAQADALNGDEPAEPEQTSLLDALVEEDDEYGGTYGDWRDNPGNYGE